MLAAADYPDVFRLLCSGRAERRRSENSNPRVRIFGLLEARLQNVDRIVLGGLNEGTWPPDTRSDPWLSRPMRLELGLNLPELRVGLSAHDFAQGSRRARGHPYARRQAGWRADCELTLSPAGRRRSPAKTVGMTH